MKKVLNVLCCVLAFVIFFGVIPFEENATAAAGDGYYSVTFNDYNSSLTYDNGVFTARMTDPDLKDSYTVNMPGTPENMCEYTWSIGFTDGQISYEAGTFYFAGGMYGHPQNYSASLYEMQNSVFELNEGWNIADASLSVDGNTLTWTFTIPEEYNFDAENMSITNARIHNINNGNESNKGDKGFIEEIKDIFETVLNFILKPFRFLLGLFG